jgi:hypothetical protein
VIETCFAEIFQKNSKLFSSRFFALNCRSAMFHAQRACAQCKRPRLQKCKKRLENKGETHIAFLRSARRVIVDDQRRAGRALPTPSIAFDRCRARWQNTQEMGCTNSENS